MKRKLLTLALVLSGILLFNGCYTYSDDYLTEYEVRQMIEQALRDHNKDMPFSKWEVIFYNVKANDWKWNDKLRQWEAFGDLPELTEDIYEEGVALGYVFLSTENGGEVQRALPYVESYDDGDDDEGNPIYFTETISCDFHLGNPSTVGFFIKSSDLFPDENAPVNYTFRILLIW